MAMIGAIADRGGCDDHRRDGPPGAGSATVTASLGRNRCSCRHDVGRKARRCMCAWLRLYATAPTRPPLAPGYEPRIRFPSTTFALESLPLIFD